MIRLRLGHTRRPFPVHNPFRHSRGSRILWCSGVAQYAEYRSTSASPQSFSASCFLGNSLHGTSALPWRSLGGGEAELVFPSEQLQSLFVQTSTDLRCRCELPVLRLDIGLIYHKMPSVATSGALAPDGDEPRRGAHGRQRGPAARGPRRRPAGRHDGRRRPSRNEMGY